MTTRGSRNSPGLLPLKEERRCHFREHSFVFDTYTLRGGEGGDVTSLGHGQSKWRDFRQLWIRVRIQTLSQDLNPTQIPLTQKEQQTLVLLGSPFLPMCLSCYISKFAKSNIDSLKNPVCLVCPGWNWHGTVMIHLVFS